MTSKTLAWLAVSALLLLQVLWHAVLAPPREVSGWLYAAFFCLPMLPALWLLSRRSPVAALVAAIAALIYFCHGVMESMSAASQRTLALAEIALSVIIILAASWNGMRGRFRKKSIQAE
ncbi:MAG: DUF2069 domain-containing protein [Lysobacteraceae bacterium]